MPSWTDESGYNWFGKIECKRCSKRFVEENGEVPVHDCIGGRFTSFSANGDHHMPTPAKNQKKLKRRSNWDEYGPPEMYDSSPKKSFIRSQYNEIYRSSSFQGKEIVLPEGATLEDLYFEIDRADESYDDEIVVSTTTNQTIVNENYEKEHKVYLKKLAEHKEEVAAWKAWKAEHDKEVLEKQLKASEEFLRKHGRL